MTLGLIQARMGSTRLPGKNMADLAGKPMLQHIIERVQRAKSLDMAAVTIPLKDHDVMLPVLEKTGARRHYRRKPEDENDLVKAFCEAAKGFKADVVVRICADNPCIEPGEIDRLVEWDSERSNFSGDTLVQNAVPRRNGYPDGIGAEIYHLEMLERLNKDTSPHVREHPHAYFSRLVGPKCPFNCPEELRLDVNTAEDLEFIRGIYRHFAPRNDFHVTEVVRYLDGKTAD